MSVFLQLPKDRIIFQDELFFIIRDKYPVSPGHSLIISNQLRADYFDLTNDEKFHLPKVIEKCKQFIEQDFTPDGYNIGMNCGEVAGQTVMHFHCHLIPRFKGDMADPRGGVRHSVEGKGYY
ncbi:HIT family protein [Rufibacter tibetensis]|uniref:Diadenosine tetraphosphate hydrolase n=1 Tax=Rufibacter tibetensis TaxID=512763 RepID=A0A0P0CM48_9BACT|nr:HIT family protein [Rufibacter tibetensis]ALJ00768.1 diadenosine tetraphosphate hydrolase [Rufibacter tibetensis]